MNTLDLIEKINKKLINYQEDYSLSEIQLMESEINEDKREPYNIRYTKSLSGKLKPEYLDNTVSSKIDKDVKEKLSNWTTRPTGTEACHIIGRCLGGSNGIQNIFIGTEKLNRKIMWPIEEIMLEEMPLPAFYKVNLIYEENEIFCSYVEITIAPLQNITKTSDGLVSGVKVKIKNM
ncbi:DNA/RNA non-specific endonuclease [Vagococcus hydrophili]|uniref:Type VII secretion system protein EssD-like domain-containing protein n=1 Tax=Vagococcus hydrophili TaxID=2714947 RepID=A0A6G8AXB4_9ENTE|nr:DNA/RNA non-specific endonuclease [Vagococcus hydrophili]QIL49698.1 hypothetical protein G7082_14895 [Vagococcus hydrophili]